MRSAGRQSRTPAVLSCLSGAHEERPGVDRLTTPPPPVPAHHDLEMEMWLPSIGVARRADEADHLTAGETGTPREAAAIRVEVGMVVHDAQGLVGGVYREAALAISMQPEHPTGIGREDGRSARRG